MTKYPAALLIMATGLAAACRSTNQLTTKNQKQMFTAEQITAVLGQVKTGSDFPRAAMQLKNLGVTYYETQMDNGQSVFRGDGNYEVHTGAAYAPAAVADEPDAAQMRADVSAHQQGKSDYFAISRQSAANGVMKWAVDLEKMSCSYIDKTGRAILVEPIPAAGYGWEPFTVEQIRAEHSNVKSGADFPEFIRKIRGLGVKRYETFVTDGHTIYYGSGDYKTTAPAKYSPLHIAGSNDASQFRAKLKAHQQGQSDYRTFCNEAAELGVEKWVVNMADMTCTYFDKQGRKMLVEVIPQ